MASRGRKLHPIWINYLRTTTDNGKHCKATCKFCGKEQYGNAERLVKHSNECGETQKNENGKRWNEENDNTSTPKKMRLDQMLVKTTPAEAHDLSILAAKFIYSNNLPFNCAENKYFREYTSSLRKGFKPPNERDVAGKLLDEVYEEQVQKASLQYEGKQEQI